MSLENFKNELSHINWINVFESNNVNEPYDIFYHVFKELYDKMFPPKRIRINTKNYISPRVTPALKNCIIEKSRLQRLAQKWPLTYRETYRKYRNKLTSLLITTKDNYYKEQLKSNQGNAKFHWKIINSVLGKTRSDNNKIELNDHCNNLSTKFN